MDIQDLLTLEHQGWRSLCEGRGGEFYGAMMTEDAVMVLSHGFRLGREAVIASLDDAPTWHRYEISGEHLVEVDEDTAILVYTGRASREDGAPPFHALMSSVYTRREGRWRLALYQQTPVPARTP